MAELSVEESRWIRRLQKVLDECPSRRLGFYTIGDPKLEVYDKSKDLELDDLMNRRHNLDFCQAVDRLDGHFATVRFPSNVHSTAG